MHEDIASLTNTKGDHIGGVWHDGHKIVRKDSHVVAIDGETLNAFSTMINEPKPVRLAGLELELGKTRIRCALLAFVGELGAVEAHLAVDQVAIGKRGKRVRGGSHDFLNKLFVRWVKPIAEHDWSDVDVVCDLTWAVDDHRSCDTSRVLSAVMGVIPRRAKDIRKEGIGHA